jgi:hypothetical protein
MRRITRRHFGALATAAVFGRTARAQSNDTATITRAIPGTGELLPVVGLGTAYVLDRNSEQTRQAAANVIRTLVEGGGRLVDTASTYGDAEDVLGATITAQGLREKIFIATKLEAPDAAELKRSLARLRTSQLDLLQLHNVNNANQSLAQFKAWKGQGAATSASLPPFIGILPRWRRSSNASGLILCRSITQSTTAKRKNGSCLRLRKSKPPC